MPLRLCNPCFGLSRRTGAIAVSCFLAVLAFVFMVLCFSQLSAGSMLPGGTQAVFAIASILQVVLVALASMIIFSSWRESTRLIRLSAYLTVTHFIFNLIVLGGLLVAVASIAPCMPQMPCSKLIIPKPAWEVLPATILFAQLYLCLIVFSYFVHLENHSRRAYVPEVSSRSLTTPASHRLDHKRLLSTSESHPPVELGAVESGIATRSLPVDGSEAGYGGGMRTYEEAEKNEKARLRLEMESEDHQAVSFPVPSTSEAGILTPLGLEWRDGDLPPYAS